MRPPRMPTFGARTVPFRMFLSEKEDEAVRALAASKEMTLAEYVRSLIQADAQAAGVPT